jgi:hypothetical protein
MQRFCLFRCVFWRDRVPKNSKVNLIEVLFGAFIVEVLLSRIISSLFIANCFPSRINRHAVAAQINSPFALWTRHLTICSLGQPAPRERSLAIKLRLYCRKMLMSRFIIDGDMLWSTKSWCSASEIWWKWCRIGISGLLVRKTRSPTVFNVRASAKSCRIIRICSFLSHSSRASTINT